MKLRYTRRAARQLDAVLAYITARSPQGAGGMGKSMVTWEWVNHHAAKDRVWEGRFWYSFYEGGANMRDFCVTGLAYMTRRPRETLASQPSNALAEQLPRVLRAKSWLLVLDGL